MARLAAAADRACLATVGRPRVAVVSGSGEFLARRLARRVIEQGGTIIGLDEAWGPIASSCRLRPRPARPGCRTAGGRGGGRRDVNRPVVIKVGGSLLDWPGLPGRLAAYLDARSAERPLVIVGGGRTADVVRDLDRAHALGEERSHRLALRALDLTAHLLAALVPGLDVVDRLDALEAVWRGGRNPVLAPRKFLDDVDGCSLDPLEASWDVTSDSIAARVANYLGATELALLKSARLPPGTDRASATWLGLVDPAFSRVAHRLERVTYLNFRDPEGAVARLLPRRAALGPDRHLDTGAERPRESRGFRSAGGIGDSSPPS